MPYVVWILFHTRGNLSHLGQLRRPFLVIYIALEKLEDVQTVARAAESKSSNTSELSLSNPAGLDASGAP